MDVAGSGYDVIIPRCVCGREMLEILDNPDGRPPFGLIRMPCPKCRDIVYEFYYEKAVPRYRLLVMQTIDLGAGEVLPRGGQVFMGHENGNRAGDRGGELLPLTVLDEALRRMRAKLYGRRK